jgi:hypothetical protein
LLQQNPDITRSAGTRVAGKAIRSLTITTQSIYGMLLYVGTKYRLVLDFKNKRMLHFFLFGIDADPMDCTNEWLFLIDGLGRHGII